MYLYQTPIEMPRGSHFGSDYWIAYSYKLKRKVHFFSMLEYANFIILEMDSNVEYFCEQPLKITDKTSLSKCSSIFDFWVQYIDGLSEFQEVKYSSELISSTESALRSKNQIEFQKNWCISNGYNYRVVTEESIYNGQFGFQNLKLLQSHLLRYHQSEKYSIQRFYKVLAQGPLSFEEIKLLKLFPENYVLSILAFQYYLGNIEIDIKDRPLDNYTEVKLCETKNITF